MSNLRYSLGVLSDPTVFAMGRLAPVSDHDTYASEAEASMDASSLSQSLNGQWKFRYSARVSERPVGFEAPEERCAAWDEIHVPGHIQLQGHGRPQYVNTQYPWDGHEFLRPPQIPAEENPVGSYVRFFEVPGAWKGHRVTLAFHGVETAFFCWVNGELIGYAEDSFTPSRFDITHALRDGENKLAVEVFRYSSASWLEDQDFWRFSGIFRDVTLSAQPAAHVRDIFVHPELDDSFTRGTLRAEIVLDLPGEPVTLKSELLDSSGAAIDALETVAMPETALCRHVERPLLWSAEKPHLYTLRLTLSGTGGTVYEVAQTRIGFRRFELKDGLMLLNGKRILLRGVNRHEFCMEAGRAVTSRHMLSDIHTLKRNNLNAVRTSHYPNNSLWYKLCDEYGVYLIDEANLETHGSWQKLGKIDPDWAVPNDDPAWLPALIDRAASMQERDKNHPSVLIWSCGNESYGGKDIFEMSEYFRRRDPSRLVHYEGVFNDRRYNGSSDMESRMYPTAKEIAAFIEAHPEKPFILCEYAHAMGNSCGGMHKYIELEDKYPQYQGGFIWDFVDQALLTQTPDDGRRLAYGGDFGDRPTDRDFCGNGILFADRTPTPKMQEVKYLYQGIRLMPDASGVTIENRFLFTNASDYLLRWRLMRNGEPVQTGTLDTLDVPPGSTRRYELPLLPPEAAGEYVLHCGLYLKQPAPWADSGYELMHGSAIIEEIAAGPAALPRPSMISRGDTNLGTRGDGFEALFSLAEGGISSLRGPDGRELLCTVPSLSLFRAPTSNDFGNGDWRRHAVWQAASAYTEGVYEGIDVADSVPRVRYRHELPLTGGAFIDVAYTVLGGGNIRIDMSWQGKAGLPDMPAFGLSLRVPREMCNIRYYGLGPEENYCDRRHGAYLGLFETTARANLTPNLLPQECGNREGVRWLNLTDAHGHGLRVNCVDSPLSVSVLPYSAMELFAARHPDELPVPAYTYLDIALRRKGVGGDNSWGAPVHPEYRIPSDRPMKLSFVLSIL